VGTHAGNALGHLGTSDRINRKIDRWTQEVDMLQRYLAIKRSFSIILNRIKMDARFALNMNHWEITVGIYSINNGPSHAVVYVNLDFKQIARR
jgi:hypothetical protein